MSQTKMCGEKGGSTLKSEATVNGICTQSNLNILTRKNQGYTYTIKDADIRTRDGINPPLTGKTIPALIGIRCHASGQNGKFILISRKQVPRYCGWVPSDSLLKPKSNRSTGNIFTRRGKVCPDIAPLTVAEYCQKMEALDESISTCDDERISASTINAKFLVWNAAPSKDQRTASALQVDKYRTSKASEKWESLDISTVLRIFDIARNDKGVFYLIGTDVRTMFGWVNQDSGTMWYTNLTTFFSKGGEGKVFSEPPWVKDALQIAKAPSNLDTMLKGKIEFPQYPVLFDRRIEPTDGPEGWKPSLEIAFIGEFHEKGQMLPDGFESLTNAEMDVFNIALPSSGNDQSQRTLAVKGFIQTAAVGESEKNWSYSIALNPGDLRPLRSSFEDLCANILETSAADTLSDNLMVVVAKLTGDDISSAEEFKQYFADRDSIPLSSQTVLGKGIMELGDALSDPSGGERVKAFQKEACRTYTLLSQIESKEKVDRPFEGKRTINGKKVTGDLVWNEKRRGYTVNKAKEHDWVATNHLDGRTIYIPLDYLPSTPESIK